MSVFDHHQGPDHPAARTLYDESGRSITLGTSEAELRLQCIYAVCPPHDQSRVAADLVREAEVLFRYVVGEVTPVLPEAMRAEPVNLKAEAPKVAMARDPHAFATISDVAIVERTLLDEIRDLRDSLMGGRREEMPAKAAKQSALSEDAKNAIRQRLWGLNNSVKYHRDMLKVYEDGMAESAEAVSKHKNSIEELETSMSILQRDLREPPA